MAPSELSFAVGFVAMSASAGFAICTLFVSLLRRGVDDIRDLLLLLRVHEYKANPDLATMSFDNIRAAVTALNSSGKSDAKEPVSSGEERRAFKYAYALRKGKEEAWWWAKICASIGGGSVIVGGILQGLGV